MNKGGRGRQHSQANAVCLGVSPHQGITAGASPRPTGTAFLPVEHPYVFAVLFEAAKAKSAIGSNRVCLAKNATAFFACNTRPQSGFLGAGP